MAHKITFDHVNKIWNGPQVPYPHGNKSVAEVAYESMTKELDFVCQISDDSGEIYTNERLLKAGISFANAIKQKGLKKGDVVVVLMHNHHYLLPTWFGCMLAGVVLCPFHYEDSSIREELTDLVQQIHPKMLITTYENLLDIFQSTLKEVKMDTDCPIYVYENTYPGCHDLKPLLENYFTNFKDFKPAGVNDAAKDTLILILSSATTGKPKLINCTHKQMLMQFTDDFSHMTFVTTALPGWQSEFISMVVTITRNGCRIIRAEYTNDQFFQMVEKYKAQLIMVKPFDVFTALKGDLLPKLDLSELLLVISSGHHLSTKVAQEFQEFIPNGVIISVYGTSEFGGSTTEPSDLDPCTPNLVGKVKKLFQYCVIDEDGDRVGPNEVGEICYTSTAPFAGYYNNEKLSKECLTPDGFFCSGDIGYIDEDGNIFLIERKKFKISYKGENLNQWEVEKIIIENVKGISGVCVVDAESDAHGVIPYIAIIPEKGVTLKEEDIIKTVMEHHPFKFETKVFFFDKLPLTISGKYKKYVIRDMILKRLNLAKK